MRTPSPGARAFELAADVIHRRAGLIVPDIRRAAVERAFEQTMQRLHVESPERFVALLAEDGPVFDEVIDYLTIGETYFFREPAQLEVLRSTVLPAMQADSGGRELRFWSAGCASGEEAYSLAIVARDAAANARVLGTDVDRVRLGMARRGRYRQWSLRGLTPEQVERFFTRDGQEYCLRPELRRAATFRQLNLVTDDFPAPSAGTGIDVIFCRNVLIYFSAEVVAQVLGRMIASLSKDGWLFVGASDPPVMSFVDCEVVETSAGLAYRRPSKARRTPIHRPETHRPAAPPVAPPPAFVAPVADVARPVAPRPPAPVPQQPVVAPTEDPIAAAYVARDFERVIALATDALTSRASSLRDLALIVRAYANLGRAREAEEACMAALDRAPESAELYALHATLLNAAGHPRAAATAARRSLYLERDQVVARIALGDASARLGDREGARRAFDHAARYLERLESGTIVPGTDGERRERLLASVRDRLGPLERAS